MLLTLTDEPQPHVAQHVMWELACSRTKGAAELGGKNTPTALTLAATAGGWQQALGVVGRIL
jgi:hypothetical protein